MHCMMDLETLGTTPGCAVLSIGAVAFDPQGEPRRWECAATFYRNIDRFSCEEFGLSADPDTMEWWGRQSEAARSALLHDAQPLHGVVGDFHDWFKDLGLTHLWCNGANFDEPIWRAATKAVRGHFPFAISYTVPWKYWNVRDTRTIWDVAGIDARRVPRDGPAHDALADARHQARCVQLAYRVLRMTHLYPPMMAETDPSPETA